MLVKLMFRFTTKVTSSPTTSRRNESASAATASNAGPSAVANARYSPSVQPAGSRSADRSAASTSVSMRSGVRAASSCTCARIDSQSPKALSRSLRASVLRPSVSIAALRSSGRVDLNAAIDTEGRNTEARSDLDSAFGDWESIRAQVHELGARTPERIDTDLLAALRSAERDPAGCTDDEYLALATAEGPALEAVAALADSLRRDVVGDDVTFVVNRNINFTNICYTGCRFCAFAQRKGDADAYSLSYEEVG